MLIGEGEAAAAALDRAERDFLLATAAEAAGGLGWCLDAAIAYAEDREQFDQSIGSFHAVAQACVDILAAFQEVSAAARSAAVGGRRRQRRGPEGGSRRRPAGRRGLPRRDRVRRPPARRERSQLGARRAPVLPPCLVRRAPGRRLASASRRHLWPRGPVAADPGPSARAARRRPIPSRNLHGPPTSPPPGRTCGVPVLLARSRDCRYRVGMFFIRPECRAHVVPAA